MGGSQVVVITGASAGIGRAVAMRFARAGASIALIARGKKGLESARREIEAAGARVLALPLDVADSEAVEHAADTVEKTLGPIDVWVNSAMVTIFASVVELTAQEIRRVTEVTYLGTVHGTLTAYRRMLPRNRGTIIQIGSALAYRSIPLQSAYCAAKAAIRGFTDALRCELIHQGSRIRLTMIQLPAVNTPQFSWCRVRLAKNPRPVAPVFQPEVIAEAVFWASRHHRREMHLGFSSLLIIFGNKIAPRLLDIYLAKNAVKGQQTQDPLDRRYGDNLFQPVDVDFGMHGDFGKEAYTRSIQFMISKHAGWVLGTMVLLAGLGVVLLK